MIAMIRTMLMGIGMFFHDLGVAMMSLGFKQPRPTSMRPPAETIPDDDTIREMRAAPKQGTWN